MSDIKPTDANPAAPAKPKLDEVLYGLFYEVFRSAGMALSIDNYEKVRQSTKKLAKAIEAGVDVLSGENKNLERIVKLAEATTGSFKGLEAKIAELEKKIVS